MHADNCKQLLTVWVFGGIIYNMKEKKKKKPNRTATNRFVVELNDRDFARINTLTYEQDRTRSAWLRRKITEEWDSLK